MDTQTLYQKALIYAASKHQEKDQKVPGTNLPYVVHLSNVAMEVIMAANQSENFNLGFAIQVALLHDSIEDTSTTFDDIKDNFGIEIAKAVSALTKNRDLPKENQILDSLNRIKELQYEVWAIKLADRITNLQPPPTHWNEQKKIKYQDEARIILNELKESNTYLANRLNVKIGEYQVYLNL